MPYLLGAPFLSIAPPTASLAGLGWELPFTGPGSDADNRACPMTDTDATVLTGPPGASYDVELQFDGIIEQKTYTGGTNDGAYWQVGGTPDAGTYNIYKLTISSPSQTYYLNRGTSGLLVCFAISYSKTVQIDVGATVTLFADSIEGLEIYDSNPRAAQYIDMTVLSVTRRP